MHFFDPITDFIFIENEPEPADVIFIPGGPCGEIALHAAELFHQGYAPLLIPSGCHSILDPVYRGAQSPEKYRGREFPTEADFFSAILMEKGVPAENTCRSVRPPSPTKTLSIQGSSPTPSVSRFGPPFSPARPITPAGPSSITRPFSRRPGSWLHPPSPRESGVRTGLDGRKPSIWSFRRWSTAAASSTKS